LSRNLIRAVIVFRLQKLKASPGTAASSAAPDPNNGVDGCCWPSLDVLKGLIEAVK
jgi:hypothetical protein